MNIHKKINKFLKFNYDKKSSGKEEAEIIKELELIRSKISYIKSNNKRVTRKDVIISGFIVGLIISYFCLGIHQRECIKYEIIKEIIGIVGFGLGIYMVTDNNTRYNANKELIFNMRIKFIELARPLYINQALPLKLREYYESILKTDENNL